MKILFWNLNKKNLTTTLYEIVNQYAIEIVVLTEAGFIKISSTKGFEVNDIIFKELVLPGSDKIRIFYKANLKLESRRGDHNCAIASFYSSALGSPIILVGLHLAAMNKGYERRLHQIATIESFIEEQEKFLKTENTIVIGDFNASPFDLELVGHNCFNAVLYKDLIKKQDAIKWEGRKIKRFYNPMLHYVSETTEMYGSCYYHEENRPLYWNCLDQVLVRKSLVDKIVNVMYIKSVGNKNLLTSKGLVNKNYSDHLPLLFEIDL